MNRLGVRGAIHLLFGVIGTAVWAEPAAEAPSFRFDRDTFAFANSTVFEYRAGVIVRRGRDKEKSEGYTRRCFVMSRSVVQFFKFARFDPKAPPVDDRELARRVRNVTRRQPWHAALSMDKRTVFPGYADLRELSRKRGRVLQENIGLGWPTYLRIGNFRMFFNHGVKYQEQTHQQLDAALDRGELFVVYLSDYPTLHINHAVTVYARRKESGRGGIDRYDCYDPNHPDGPRELEWLRDKGVFNFEKDEEFVGGFTRAYHVYGKPFQ